jgi:hypothetical protein
MMFLCGIPWKISGYEGALHTFHTANMFHFFCFVLSTLYIFYRVSSYTLYWGCSSESEIKHFLINYVIVPSLSEPRTSIDAILDTEVIKYFFIFPRQRKILSLRLLTKKIWESHFQCFKNSWKLAQVPSVSYLESHMKIQLYARCVTFTVTALKAQSRKDVIVTWYELIGSNGQERCYQL